MSSLDKELPVYDVRTMQQYVSLSLAEPRFNGLVVGLFAGLALILTAIGLYGVMAQTAFRRRREMSIRLALGAPRSEIVRLIVGKGLVLTLTGLGIGTVCALWTSRLLKSFLFGVRTTDAWTFGAVSLLLVTVGLLGSYGPARSVTRADPATTLRDE